MSFFIKHRFLLLILLFYFILSLINLTKLPIFNDEAIYLDWGWFNLHVDGHLYDSLLDAKQPLIIWIFGIFESLFSDPLFAGRFASVLIGFGTLLGVYKVTKKMFAEHIALLAAFIYTITPIFVFYNRQALLEAGVAAVGIWSFNALLNLLCKTSSKNGIILGVWLGVGFFVKTSTLLFFIPILGILCFYLIKRKRLELVKPSLLGLGALVAVDFLLFINPLFWQSLATNSRYSLTLPELFSFPLALWVSHLWGFFAIGFVFLTPLLFLAGIAGIYLLKKNKVKDSAVFLFYFLFALGLEIFSARFQNQRYVFPFLTFLPIIAAYVFYQLWQGNFLKKFMVVIAIALPTVLSLVQIGNPETYILQTSRYSKYSDIGYIRGQTSGYGVTEVMRYIKEHSVDTQPTLIFFGLNIGNPESAVDVYSLKDLQLYGLHLDSKLLPGIDQYQCLQLQYPAFFVTRYAQLSGMDRYFELAKSFPNPDGQYSIGLYTLKKNCKGTTASLTEYYQPAIQKLYSIKSGNQ